VLYSGGSMTWLSALCIEASQDLLYACDLNLIVR
jgi:hypothetical protein